jgi:hypothetical protein
MKETRRENQIVVGVCCLIVMFVLTVLSVVIVEDYYEVKTFNKIYGTNYSFKEWFWAEQTIKNYHLAPENYLKTPHDYDLGTIENLNGGIE